MTDDGRARTDDDVSPMVHRPSSIVCRRSSVVGRLFLTMAIEIEKKYRLTKKQRAELLRRLPVIGATLQGEEFEENTLYGGDVLDVGRCVLRLRRVGDSAILTYKERFPSSSSIKQQREVETRVSDAD